MQFNDVFNEQLVKRKANNTDMIKRVGIIVGAVVISLISMSIAILQSIAVFIVIAAIVGAVFLWRMFNIEYEYAFTNGELDIDRITNKNRRKRAFSVEIKKVDIMAPVNKKEYERELGTFDKQYDFSSGIIKDNTYAAICNLEGKRVKFIIEPNEKMFEAIRAYIPRKIKK